MPEMEMVSSSNIRAIGHDAETETLTIEFVTGTVYEYAGVSSETYEEFKSAPSVGAYFHQNIRNVYTGVRV